MNNEAKLSCCNACFLSQTMKDCKECPFNPANIKLTLTEKTDEKILSLIQGAKAS